MPSRMVVGSKFQRIIMTFSPSCLTYSVCLSALGGTASITATAASPLQAASDRRLRHDKEGARPISSHQGFQAPRADVGNAWRDVGLFNTPFATHPVMSRTRPAMAYEVS